MIHRCNIRRNLFMKNKKLLLGIGIMCCLWCLPKIVHGKEKKVSFSLVELKCENMVDPLGIDNVTPHLSWKLKGDGLGWLQERTKTRRNRVDIIRNFVI